MSNQSPAEALRLLRRKFNLALMANYPGTTASNQFLDDLLLIVTAYAATVEREALRSELTDLKNLAMMKGTTVSGLNRVIGTHLARLAALQGPIQGDSE